MTVQITRAQLDKSGIVDLDAEIAAFQKARNDHAQTVDVPAPAAHPYIEEIVRKGGTYEIVEEAPDKGEPLPPSWSERLDAQISDMQARIAALEAR